MIADPHVFSKIFLSNQVINHSVPHCQPRLLSHNASTPCRGYTPSASLRHCDRTSTSICTTDEMHICIHKSPICSAGTDLNNYHTTHSVQFSPQHPNGASSLRTTAETHTQHCSGCMASNSGRRMWAHQLGTTSKRNTEEQKDNRDNVKTFRSFNGYTALPALQTVRQRTTDARTATKLRNNLEPGLQPSNLRLRSLTAEKHTEPSPVNTREGTAMVLRKHLPRPGGAVPDIRPPHRSSAGHNRISTPTRPCRKHNAPTLQALPGDRTHQG